MNLLLPACLAGLLIFSSPPFFPLNAQERSIRFYGNGFQSPDNDRIKIALENESAVNVGDDFTIECWLKCLAYENQGFVSESNKGDGWITGNIFLDRDVYGNADSGDFGLALGAVKGLPSNTRVVAFGINRLGSGTTIHGSTNIGDNKWHHIAITRDGKSGAVNLFVDGKLDGWGNGPTGSVIYPSTRQSAYPASDPFMVLGAEKHDAGSAFPSYSGYMDELRISSTVRYNADFAPALTPFVPDSATAALYHFNEGNGTTVENDAPGRGPSYGSMHVGGKPVGPAWHIESPFTRLQPLDWKSITARKETGRVIITWLTGENVNASTFEVQRSNDGINFTGMAQQPASLECDGNCSYSFTDTHPIKGKNIYRIKNTSSTGQVTHSSTTQVLFDQKLNPFKIYQSGNSLVVQNTSTIESLVAWNREGRRLLEKKNIAHGTTYIPLQQSRGFAFVHINLEDGTRFTEKVMLK